jgi:phosphate transport system permease protein
MTRYAKKSWLTDGFRFMIEVLSGTPSIVIGMFGFLIFVYYMKSVTGGYSLISGSIALSILIMPVMERATEEAILTVPKDLEEGSYALGATKWQTIRDITIPFCISGIITGIILGFGRAAEESAVVIMTAGYSQFMPEFAIKAHPGNIFGIKIYPFQDLVGTLPYAVYHAYENSNVIKLSNGFAAAFILVCVVLCINLSTKAVLSYRLSGKRSRAGVSSLFSINSVMKGALSRFYYRIKPDETSSAVQDKSPDIVLFGIRFPHRSGYLSGKNGQDFQTAVDGEGVVTTTDRNPANSRDLPSDPSSVTVPSSTPDPDNNSTIAPVPEPQGRPSITDGFAGIILGSAGMGGFLGLIYGIRFLTKDTSLELGSVVLVILLTAIVVAVSAYQYMKLKRRGV